MEYFDVQGKKAEITKRGRVNFRFLGETIQVSEAAQEYNKILTEFSALSREKSEAFVMWSSFFVTPSED